jgi:hypothetical protein
VNILLQRFGYTAVVFGTSRVSAFVREPLKGFSRNLVVDSIIKRGGHVPVVANVGLQGWVLCEDRNVSDRTCREKWNMFCGQHSFDITAAVIACHV